MPRFATDAVELNYRLEGPEGAPVVVFSNSLGTTLAMWDAQVAALSGEFRCLRYDTRGHGESGLPEAVPTLDDLAGDLAGLMEGLGIGHAHLVGLSLGGMTAQALAAARPDLVDRLVLVATAAYAPPRDMWQQRAAAVRAGGLQVVADGVIERWFTPAHRDGEGARATRRQLEEQVSAGGYAACCEAIGAMDLRERIGAIRAPALVVSGAEDPSTPPEKGREIQSLIPGAEFMVVPEAAHMIAVEHPDTLTAIIRSFLGGTVPPRSAG